MGRLVPDSYFLKHEVFAMHCTESTPKPIATEGTAEQLVDEIHVALVAIGKARNARLEGPGIVIQRTNHPDTTTSVYHVAPIGFGFVLDREPSCHLTVHGALRGLREDVVTRLQQIAADAKKTLDTLT